MLGQTVWHGHPTLNRPITILGVERRWFLMSATVGLGMWNAIGAMVPAGLIFAVLYAAGVLALKRDPAMLQIIAAGQSARARYDPGKPTRAAVEIV